MSRLTPMRVRVLIGSLSKEVGGMFALPAVGAFLGCMGYAGHSWWWLAKIAAVVAMVSLIALTAIVALDLRRDGGAGEWRQMAGWSLALAGGVFLLVLTFLSLPYLLGMSLAG